MYHAIDFAFSHVRTVLLTLCFFLIAGAYSYINIPKEASPDIPIPILIVNVHHEGISPEDGERLIIRPLEKQLRSIEGVKEITAKAYEGNVAVTLEFEAGFDNEKALADVREKVDLAQPDLPVESDEPNIKEVNFSLFPVIVVGLSGDFSEKTLVRIARNLRDKIEEHASILEVQISGDREELVEITLDPNLLETYNLRFDEIIPLFKRNNQLVAAGTLDTGMGRLSFKVPGLFETAEDILNAPIKVDEDRVIRVRDIAWIRQTFKDPTTLARINGKPSVGLEVIKRSGENVIETINLVKDLIKEELPYLPAGLEITYSQDQSEEIQVMLSDLQNNLLSAIILVMLVVLATLGTRTALLVGFAIPGSFLIGLFILNLMGLTINNVVLFSLILAVGMLVDGAIVVTEFADRKMTEGHHRREAYLLASKRMALPVIASTATTLAAFMPLLFWPGIVGEFMKFLPITLITTLTASLVMALIFVPTLGKLFGKPGHGDPEVLSHLAGTEKCDFSQFKGLTGWYIQRLQRILQYPGRVLGVACVAFVSVYSIYIFFGKGLEFFTDVEPDQVFIGVRIRGNLALEEVDTLLHDAESRIRDIEGLKNVYVISSTESRSVNFGGSEFPEDTLGTIQLEFTDWQLRPKAKQLVAKMRERLESIPGIVVEIQEDQAGPPTGKAVQIQLSSRYPDLLPEAVETVLAKLDTMEGLKDITDSRPVPAIEWRLDVDRAQAARYGADVQTAGEAIKFMTTGLKVGDYRPDDSDDEVDINIRFPHTYRTLNQVNRLRIPTLSGVVPIQNFMNWYAAPKVGRVERSDGMRVLTVTAGIQDDVLADDKVHEIQSWLQKESPLNHNVLVQFRGEDEEQKAAQQFLLEAFYIALAVMAIILVTQFNSFYQALLILTAVVFSTLGVFLGLLITQQPFSIVMNGIGVIALAGIVVNNNIVLIDTYARIKNTGLDTLEAVLRTCAQRLRPILLTTVTTILGLLPMVIGLNIDFIGREVTLGAPSTQWWKQLSTSVAFGLTFATMLTLVLTPALLMLGDYLPRFKDK
tara:strand:- start:20970 stop:24098 length:3129 start_codon:yes stop_codon:yes gene_type:complete